MIVVAIIEILAAVAYANLVHFQMRTKAGEGKLTLVSLRSSEGGALRMAKQLQGGGHANAAGAALPKRVQRGADAVDYLKTALNPITHAQENVPDNLESLFESAKI